MDEWPAVEVESVLSRPCNDPHARVSEVGKKPTETANRSSAQADALKRSGSSTIRSLGCTSVILTRVAVAVVVGTAAILSSRDSGSDQVAESVPMPGYLVGVIAGGNGLVTKDPNFGPNPPTIEAGRFVVDRFAVPFTLTLEASGSWLVSEYSSTLVSISQASPGVVPGGTFAVFTGAPAAVAGIVAVDEASATAICPGATFAPVQEATLSDAPAVKVTGVAAAACAPNPVTFIGPNTTFEVTIGMLDGRVIGVIASAPTGQWGAVAARFAAMRASLLAVG